MEGRRGNTDKQNLSVFYSSRDFLILVSVICGVFLAIYGWIEVSGPRKKPVREQEQSLFSEEFKRRLADSFEENMVFVDNKNLREYKRVLNQRFIPNMEQPDNFKAIKIIDDDQLNAFTTIGDRVYLFKGLIKGIDDPYLVAAVVAHELGHINHGHVEDRLKLELGTSLISSIITGGNNGMVMEMGRTMMTLSYNRSQEEEADEYARELLEQANINPQRLAQAFLRLKSLSKKESPVDFLSTHPSLESRIEQTLKYAVAAGFKEKTISIRWEKLISSLDK